MLGKNKKDSKKKKNRSKNFSLAIYERIRTCNFRNEVDSNYKDLPGKTTVTHSPNKYSHLTQHLTNSIVNEKLSVLSGKAHIT